MITKTSKGSWTLSESSRELSWRLVHDGVSVLALFESEGVTGTKFTLFTGTRAACDAEIARLGLSAEIEVVTDETP